MNPNIKVDCYSGYRGDERPHQVYYGHHRLEIDGIREQWITPHSRCFKIVTADNRVYRLEQDVATDRWTIMPVPGQNGQG